VKNKDIIYKRYKQSILIDSIIFLFLWGIFSIVFAFFDSSSIIRSLSFIPTSFIIFGYLTSDYYFKNQSLGKRLTKIKVINKSKRDQKPELTQIIKRRVFEFIMMAFLGRRYDLYHALEEDTNTKIVEVKSS